MAGEDRRSSHHLNDPRAARLSEPGATPGSENRAARTPGSESRAAHQLNEKLNGSPWGFDFFEAMRRLECSRPDLPRIGTSHRLAEDPVRLGQQPSLGFAPTSISGYEARSGGLPPRLYVAFMGLLGPNGPLPLHITEYARDRQLNLKDPTIARFLDIFNHRMISFFYRAWATNQKAVHFERGPATWQSVAAVGQTRSSAPAEDRFIAFVLSTFGMGMPGMLGRDAVPDIAKAWYSGRLACQTRHAEGLESIVGDYFRVPCRIIQFIGQWLDLPKDCLLKVGETRRTGLLGQSTIIGSRIWDCQQRFRIRLGPLTLAQYQRMLPEPPAYERRNAAAKGASTATPGDSGGGGGGGCGGRGGRGGQPQAPARVGGSVCRPGALLGGPARPQERRSAGPEARELRAPGVDHLVEDHRRDL